MKTNNKAYVMVGVFLVGFYAGQATNSTDITNWKFIVELGSVLAGVGGLGTFYIAYIAMRDWKKSLANNIAINSAIELEDKLTRFVQACMCKPDERVGNKDLLLYEDVTRLSWRLRRRNFSTKELLEIEGTMHEVVSFMRNKTEIPSETMDKLFDSLNKFTKSF